MEPMYLMCTERFWERDGRTTFLNDRMKSILEITHHAFKRMSQRNVRLDSVLALAEFASKDPKIRSMKGDVFCIQYKTERSEDSVLIPFVMKRLVSGDVVLYAKTIWRFLNENNDFYFEEENAVFNLSLSLSGEPIIEEIDKSQLLIKTKKKK
jgi:hypothetical protein